MKLGILGTAEIAFRRFLPALQQCSDITYAGVASRNPEKGKPFQEQFGGVIYDSYDALLADDCIDAVYVPLPPALHYEWGKKVLLAGKHLFMEKPFTTSVAQTAELLELAEEKGLAVHENYMFLYHSQLDWIREQAAAGAIGELRLIRASFGFPFRGNVDFRYDKALGGGALLDCGGYPVRLATELLGGDVKVIASRLNQGRGLDVDVYGSVTLENECGQAAQIAFGMDNSYQCDLELWGSTGCLRTGRIFTAPAGFAPTVTIQSQAGVQSFELAADDSFRNSIEKFCSLTKDAQLRPQAARRIALQSELVETIQKEGTNT